MRLWWIVLVVVVEATAFADPDPALEKRFRDDIAAVSGEAAAAWDAANAARDAHHPSEAADGYRKAIALAPKVDHPHRRLCSMLMLQHQLDEAAAECERAMQLAPASPYDASTYAYVLLRRDQAGDRARAVTLASQAARALPNDPDVVGTQCTALAFENDIDAMRGCVDHLLDIAPNSVVANLHGVQLAMFDHDPTHASIYLERAKTPDCRMPSIERCAPRSTRCGDRPSR